MKVVCIIPAWNEEKKLSLVIQKLKGKVDEIIVIDDCSSDKTIESIKDLDIILLCHLVNRGQGAALKTGTEYAINNNADIIVHFDADGQFRVEDIERVVEPIKNNQAEIVFGSRFLDDTTKMPLFKKNFIMPLARVVNRFLFNIKTTDPQSGFRAFSRMAAEKIDWQQDEMAHCSEILVAAYKTGLPIVEVPITVLYEDFGQRFGGGLKILKDIFLAKLNN